MYELALDVILLIIEGFEDNLVGKKDLPVKIEVSIHY